MAVVRPFNGIIYNAGVVGSLDSVVTPPYDVISPADQQRYYERSPYNVIRLILPKEEADSKYEHAAHDLHEWLKVGALTRDHKPCFYACEQEFEVNGEVNKRFGITCLVHLEDYDKKTVLPHENTLAKPREDRLNMMRATGANLDSVFGLYSGAKVDEMCRQCLAYEPDATAVDKDGVVCRLWRIANPKSVAEIESLLSSESILIADGHHRYAAALEYRNEMRAKVGTCDPEAPYEYVMMTLVSFDDEGLVVFPTHRLVRNVEGFDPESFVLRLTELFDLGEVPADSLMQSVESMADQGTVFGLYLGGGRAYTVKLKPDVKPEQVIETPGSDALKRLDVSVLHSIILDKLLGIDAQHLSAQSNLSYTRDPEGAMKQVDAGEYQMLFLMNPTKVEEVKAVAGAGDKMPQKSTYFYPKLLTGLILRVM